MFNVVERNFGMAVAPLHERFRRRTKCRFCIELRGAHAGAGGESSIHSFRREVAVKPERQVLATRNRDPQLIQPHVKLVATSSGTS